MNVFFFGIYELGILGLRRLLEAGARIRGVATKLQAGPHLQTLCDVARQRRLPLFAVGPGDEAGLERSIKSLKPDLIVVSGFHRLIPMSMLGLAPLGGINLHPSLLPKYRGPCPWKWVIVQGETRTGVSVHHMDASFDTGPVIAQEPVAVRDDETGGELFLRLCDVGTFLLVRTVRALEHGPLPSRPQDAAQATRFGSPKERDARIDWSADGERIRNLVRGFNPRPGAWTTLEGERIAVQSVTTVDVPATVAPGTILRNSREGLLVGSGGGIVLVQATGPAGEVLGSANGIPLRPGMVFEDPMRQATPQA